MELHRFKGMPENYDRELFNSLYHQTEALRNSLVYQIDARRFGVTPDIIKSWFDDKFMFVFSKYFQDKEPDMLKGYLINSLKMFKFRVLRKAYQSDLMEFYNNVIDLDDVTVNTIIEENVIDNKSLLMGIALDFFKENLSHEAYQILEIQISPPFYITAKLKNPHSRIPTALFLEYLEIPATNEALRRINHIRKQIDVAIGEAREFFSHVNLDLA